MKACAAWLRSQVFAEEPGPVLADPDVPAEQLQPVRLISEMCLAPLPKRTTKGFHYWWLRDCSSDSFVRISLPRGDEPLDVVRWLAPGSYRLGTGRGPHTIRLRIEVSPPASEPTQH